MGLHNDLIAILAVGLLFLGANRWHAKAEIHGSVTLYGPPISTSDKTELCSQIVSYKEAHYVPYTETYRTRSRFIHDQYQILLRPNYKLEYHTVNKIEATCCNGYVQIGVTCQPRCPQSCKKGTCLVPDVCECNEGYRSTALNTTLNGTSNGELCAPICPNDCIAGACIEPNVCVCNEGYAMYLDNFTCSPVCDSSCEQNNGYCAGPNVCKCLPDYRSVDGNNTIAPICEPVCDACTNGRCTGPNVCECEAGYAYNKHEPQSCRPKCNETCVFGKCTAPDTCTCNEGYKAINETSVCEPICSEPCVEGFCVAPETCRCNDGYAPHNKTKTQFVCVPFCEKDCGNGECTAPGICTCDKGYIYDQKDETCKPYCEIPCGNGTCVSPHNCSCYEGYTAKVNREFEDRTLYLNAILGPENFEIHMCKPICDYRCIHGTCIAPNTYICMKGYKLIVRKDNVRVCIPERVDPTCFLRIFNSCWEYMKCGSLDACICNVGYKMSKRTLQCVPVCATKCTNGACTAPNRCTCNEGYERRNDTHCEPICKNDCANGDCIGPNRCVCRDGFVLNIRNHTAEECVPTCSRNCSGHGECRVIDEEDRCVCHLGWTGRDCDRPSMCALTMDLNHVDIDRITINNNTNSTIMQVYERAPHCHRCDYPLNNESLCYAMRSDEGDVSTVGCLLSADLPCNMTPHYNASTNVIRMVWSFTTVAIVFITILITAGYFVYRRHQRKRLTAARISTNSYARESFATESLLSESVIYL